MRSTLFLTAALLSLAPLAGAQTISVFGTVGLQAISSEAPTPWIDGGFGRLQAGTGLERTGEALLGELNLGLEWVPTRSTSLFVHVIGRGESQAIHTWTAGVVEAWAETRFRPGPSQEVRLRGGTMILPTSRENTGVFWSSPYLISFSAINSWIAEEVRPTGIDLQLQLDDGTRALRLAATGFVGNDTAGTLLGWRGWAIGNRLTTLGERLPLPPLHSLPDSFPLQRPETTPFDDLDGRVGWAARARFDLHERLTLQATRYDNRGDRDLHGSEYAWRTRFDHVALELRAGAGFTILSEHVIGSTLMGPDTGARVAADFDSTYVLASWSHEWFRASARWDRFRTVDRDLSAAEINDEDGTSVAVAVAIEPNHLLRVAIEYIDVDVERPSSFESGGPLQNGGSAILLHVRLAF